MGMNAMSEEDPFGAFKNSSPLHAAIMTPGGELIVAVPVSGDEEALMAFQPVALKILEVAAKHSRHITEHLIPGRRGGRLYDRISIHP
jgi:hypothetical protein